LLVSSEGVVGLGGLHNFWLHGNLSSLNVVVKVNVVHNPQRTEFESYTIEGSVIVTSLVSFCSSLSTTDIVSSDNQIFPISPEAVMDSYPLYLAVAGILANELESVQCSVIFASLVFLVPDLSSINVISRWTSVNVPGPPKAFRDCHFLLIIPV